VRLAALGVKPAAATRVDAWWRCLDVDDEACERLTALLSKNEHQHAQRFHSAIHRRRYIVRRGILRELLADHLVCGPKHVPITHTTFGKPYIEGSDLTFNLSHSHGMALYAFARGPEIGCDVEWQAPRFATRETAELVLSPAEIAAWRLLPDGERTAAFFDYWTCKEAYIKALGVGFALPPHEITVLRGRTPRFIALPEDDDPAEWSLARIELEAGYAAAFAMRGPPPIIHLN
jgi:4'-phosphopantetheinyl transferase